MTRSKNILLFFSVGIIGGTETSFIKIARDLNAQGVNVYVAVVDNNGPLLSLIKPFIQDYCVINFLKTDSFIRSIFKYYKFIQKNKINCVFNFGLKVEVFSRLFSKLFGVQKIISNIRSTDPWRKTHHILLDRITSFSVDMWISNSFAGKVAFINREKINPEKCHVIYNYIDEFNLGDFQNKEYSQELHIGILSNIKPGKGFEDLIRLSEMLLANNVKFKIYIAGVDMMHGYFQSLLSDKGLDQYFILLGYISEKASFFKNIDIVLLPSYVEGMPTSILESMQFGIPVIATDVGGIPELVTNNYNGILVQPGDIKAMFDALIILRKNIELKNSFIKNSMIELKEKFSRETILNQWLNVLNI